MILLRAVVEQENHEAGNAQIPAFWFVEFALSSRNSDRAFSVNGNVDTLHLIGIVIRDFHARNRLVFVAVLAALSRKGMLVKRDLD